MEDAVQTVMQQCELWTDNNNMVNHGNFETNEENHKNLIETYKTKVRIWLGSLIVPGSPFENPKPQSTQMQLHPA